MPHPQASLPDQIGTKFQRLPPIFGVGGFNGAIADVGRQPEIAMAANKPEVAITQEQHMKLILPSPGHIEISCNAPNG